MFRSDSKIKRSHKPFFLLKLGEIVIGKNIPVFYVQFLVCLFMYYILSLYIYKKEKGRCFKGTLILWKGLLRIFPKRRITIHNDDEYPL
jgi:hypothetical protein